MKKSYHYSIGNIIEVNSSYVTILTRDFVNLETINYRDKIYKGLSIGAFVGVIRGSDKIVVQITEELINNIEEGFDDSTFLKNNVKRKLVAKIIGLIEEGEYKNGTKIFPFMFDDVVLLNDDELKIIFYLPQEEKNQNVLDIGKMSLYNKFRVKIPINGFLDTHIGVFGNTGSGKSNTVAKLYTALFDKIKIESKSKNINSTFVFVDFHNEYEKYFSKYKKNVKIISPSNEDFKISAPSFWNYETLIRDLSDFSQEEKKFIKDTINFKKEYDLNIYYNMIKDINEYSNELNFMQLEEIWEKYKNYEGEDLKTLFYIDSLSKMREFKHLIDAHSKGGKPNYSTLKRNKRYLEMIEIFSWNIKEITFKDYIEKINIYYEREWVLCKVVWFYERLITERGMVDNLTKGYLLKNIFDTLERLYNIRLSSSYYRDFYMNYVQKLLNPKLDDRRKMSYPFYYFEKDEISKLEKIKVYLAMAKLIYKVNDIQNNIIDKIQNKLLDSIPKNMSYIPAQIEIDRAQIMILSLKDEDVELQKRWPTVVANELFNSQKLLDSSGIKRSIHFIIDEAHNLISSKLLEETKDENINRLSLFEKFIREGRKFNFFLTISTQEPWGLDSGITSQLGNFFIHRFTNGNDLERINKYIMNLNDILYNKISILNPGQCVLWGSKFKTPLMIQVDELEKENKNKSLEQLWGLQK